METQIYNYNGTICNIDEDQDQDFKGRFTAEYNLTESEYQFIFSVVSHGYLRPDGWTLHHTVVAPLPVVNVRVVTVFKKLIWSEKMDGKWRCVSLGLSQVEFSNLKLHKYSVLMGLEMLGGSDSVLEGWFEEEPLPVVYSDRWSYSFSVKGNVKFSLLPHYTRMPHIGAGLLDNDHGGRMGMAMIANRQESYYVIMNNRIFDVPALVRAVGVYTVRTLASYFNTLEGVSMLQLNGGEKMPGFDTRTPIFRHFPSYYDMPVMKPMELKQLYRSDFGEILNDKVHACVDFAYDGKDPQRENLIMGIDDIWQGWLDDAITPVTSVIGFLEEKLKKMGLGYSRASVFHQLDIEGLILFGDGWVGKREKKSTYPWPFCHEMVLSRQHWMKYYSTPRNDKYPNLPQFEFECDAVGFYYPLNYDHKMQFKMSVTPNKRKGVDVYQYNGIVGGMRTRAEYSTRSDDLSDVSYLIGERGSLASVVILDRYRSQIMAGLVLGQPISREDAVSKQSVQDIAMPLVFDFMEKLKLIKNILASAPSQTMIEFLSKELKGEPSSALTQEVHGVMQVVEYVHKLMEDTKELEIIRGVMVANEITSLFDKDTIRGFAKRICSVLFTGKIELMYHLETEARKHFHAGVSSKIVFLGRGPYYLGVKVTGGEGAAYHEIRFYAFDLLGSVYDVTGYEGASHFPLIMHTYDMILGGWIGPLASYKDARDI